MFHTTGHYSYLSSKRSFDIDFSECSAHKGETDHGGEDIEQAPRCVLDLFLDEFYKLTTDIFTV